jgi:hypothetical protein
VVSPRPNATPANQNMKKTTATIQRKCTAIPIPANSRTNRNSNSISIVALYPLPNIAIGAGEEFAAVYSGDEYREVVALLCDVVEMVEVIEDLPRRQTVRRPREPTVPGRPK